MTETAITKPKDLGDLFKNRIHDLFAEVIPEETMKAVVEIEWDNFFNKRAKTTSMWGTTQEDQTPFEKLVRSVMEERVKAALVPKLDAMLQPDAIGRDIFDPEAQTSVFTKALRAVLPELKNMVQQIAVEIMSVGLREFINRFGRG